MASREDRERDLRSDPTGNMESPFLEGELFVGESAPDWETRLSAFEGESPFLSAFPHDRTTSSTEREDWEAWEAPEEQTEQLVVEEETRSQPPILQPMNLSADCIR